MIAVLAIIAVSRCVFASVKIRILSLSSGGCPIVSRGAVDALSLEGFNTRLDGAWSSLALVKGVPAHVNSIGTR